MLINRYTIGATAVVLGLSAVFLYGQWQYRQGYQRKATEQYVAELEAFKAQVQTLDVSAKQIALLTHQLKTQSNQWKTNYGKTIKQEPLPSDCLISTSRLQHLNQAISDSAATRQSRRAVRGSGKLKQ